MENDIQIEQLSKINQQKDEKLRKMKSNIQKLQMNMNKKRDLPLNQVNNTRKQPITSYNNLKNDYAFHQKPYDNPNFNNNVQEFGYDSNLYRQLNNQSQGVLQNGSAVSNFSSVSNINNLLNAGNLQQQYKMPQAYQYSTQKGSNYKDQNNIIVNRNPSLNEPTILNDIDKLLERTKKSKKQTPFKDVQRYTQIKEMNQNNKNNNSSGLNNFHKNALPQGQNTTKNKLNQYKRFIQSLNPLNSHQKDKFYKTEKNYQAIETGGGGYKKPNIQTFTNFNQNKFEQLNQKQKIEPMKSKQVLKKHKKDQPSNTTNKSEYLYNYSKSQHPVSVHEQSYLKLPPTPPLSNRKPLNTLVQRQKAQIKSSMQQYKKLQNEIVQDQIAVQLDFELSDDDSEQRQQQNKQKQQKISKLLAQKELLIIELQQIDRELEQLQNKI